MSSNVESDKRIRKLLEQLTIEEKAALLEGYRSWMTNPVPRLGIPGIHLTDGPAGVRRKADSDGQGVMGLGRTLPSTAFPAGVSLGSTFDRQLLEEVGRAIGEECVRLNVQVLLGPAINLKRDPRCGRNFEYYSEDPVLSGELGAAYINGLQSTGTAACVKHYALNNCEKRRYTGNSVADERAVRELYLKAFEIAIRKGKPKAVMCAYNRVNSVYCSENSFLLRQVLRKEWGYQGLTMTDWGATTDRLRDLKAGMDLDMPGGIWDNRKALIRGMQDGTVSEQADEAAGRVLHLVLDVSGAQHPESMPPMEELLEQHGRIALKAALEGAVLLRNEKNTLPLTGKENLLVVGEFFEKMRYQGAGSSGLAPDPAMVVTPKQAFDRAGIRYTYEKGFGSNAFVPDPYAAHAAVVKAQKADTVMIFAGLPEVFESEGIDRDNLLLPDCQSALIRRLAQTGAKVIVVLFCGSPVELPFAEDVGAILYMGLPGEAGGEAAMRLLYGRENPSGRLAQTWVRSMKDLPAADTFGKRQTEEYRESIFMGYRYYEDAPQLCAFAFGHGLSYTEFSYSDPECTDGEVSFKLTNTGKMYGTEIVQLYAGRNENRTVFLPRRTLIGFERVSLKPGESRIVHIPYELSDLSYWNRREQRFVLENGEYPLYIAASAEDIRLKCSIRVSGQKPADPPDRAEVVQAYECMAADTAAGRKQTPLTDPRYFAAIYGGSVPGDNTDKWDITLETPLSDYSRRRGGRLINRGIDFFFRHENRKISRMPEGEEKEACRRDARFMQNLVPRNSIRSLVQSSGGGRVRMKMAHAAVEFANGHVLKAIHSFFAREKVLPLPSEQQEQTHER